MKYFFVKSFKVLNVLLILTVWGQFTYMIVDKIQDDKKKEEEKQKIEKEKNSYNVALIKINGEINLESADKILEKIEKADSDSIVKAMVFELNSRGGEISPSFEIESFVRASKKYKVSYIRSSAASGAYLIASATDSIYATITSPVGSISANGSFIENSKKLEKEGRTFNSLISGKYKNMFNPNKPLTSEERKIIMKNLKYHHDNFIDRVSLNRNISKDLVSSIADGRVYFGEKALNLRLVDKLVENTLDVEKELEKYIEEKVKIKTF